MKFLNYSMDNAQEYKDFILKHNYIKTEKEYWLEVSKSGKKVIPYSERFETENSEEIYFEFVDEDLNIYVEFFNKSTKKWVESYVFQDSSIAWTILVDNFFYGNPLGIKEE